MSLLCWVREIWFTLNNWFPTSGHIGEVIEEHQNKTVEVTRCMTCGRIDISWK